MYTFLFTIYGVLLENANTKSGMLHRCSPVLLIGSVRFCQFYGLPFCLNLVWCSVFLTNLFSYFWLSKICWHFLVNEKVFHNASHTSEIFNDQILFEKNVLYMSYQDCMIFGKFVPNISLKRLKKKLKPIIINK